MELPNTLYSEVELRTHYPILPTSEKLASWIANCSLYHFGGEIILGLLPTERLIPNLHMLVEARKDVGLAPEFNVKDIVCRAFSKLSKLPDLTLRTIMLPNGKSLVKLRVEGAS